MKLLLDEHLTPAYRTGLLRRSSSIVVLAVGMPGAPSKGTLDPDILHWCEAEDFILVTNNRASMPVHLADHMAVGRHIPGIFVIDPYRSMAEILDELMLIAGASLDNEYRDRLVYLPLNL